MVRAPEPAVRSKGQRDIIRIKTDAGRRPASVQISLTDGLRRCRRWIFSRLLRLRRGRWFSCRGRRRFGCGRRRCGCRRRRWSGRGRGRRSRCRRCLSDLDQLQLPAVEIGRDLSFATVIRRRPSALGGTRRRGRGSFGRVRLRSGFARVGLSCCLGCRFLACIGLGGRCRIRLRCRFARIGLRSRFGLSRCLVRLPLCRCTAQATEYQRSR